MKDLINNQNKNNDLHKNQNEEEKQNVENFNNLSHHSLHSITSIENFNSREKATFQEEIHKTIEKEIKRDSLINDINLSLNSKENNLEGKKYNDMINNIFLNDDILNSESNIKTLETEEKKVITPNFSPLNLNNSQKFDFAKEEQNKKNIFVLLLKSW